MPPRRRGRGFAQYRGRLPHSETAVPKISYVVRFAPWDWNITSGVFIKDIDTVYYETLLGHLLVVLVIGAVISFAMVLIIRNVRASLGGEPDSGGAPGGEHRQWRSHRKSSTFIRKTRPA